MIYCPQCGNPNFDDANFCDTCGEPLVNAEVYAQMRNQAEMAQYLEAQRQQKQAQAYNKAFRKAEKEAKKAAAKADRPNEQTAYTTSSGEYVGASASAVPNGANTTYSTAGSTQSVPNTSQSAQSGSFQASPVDFTVYKHGCAAQAWDDITESEGWGKKITLLGLTNMVPILNFFVTGYAMKWACELEDDRVEPMPKNIFGDGYFVQGFFAFVVALVLGIVSGIVNSILGNIPVLGAICAIAVSLFVCMFQNLSVMRVAISKELGPGFSVKEICKAMFSDNFGKAFCATVVPGLIIGAASLFICGSIIVIFAMSTLTTLVNLADMAQSGYMNWSVLISMIASILPVLLVCYLVAAFLGALNTVLTLRATSHYIMRYCGSWRALVPSANNVTFNAPPQTGGAPQQDTFTQQQGGEDVH